MKRNIKTTLAAIFAATLMSLSGCSENRGNEDTSSLNSDSGEAINNSDSGEALNSSAAGDQGNSNGEDPGDNSDNEAENNSDGAGSTDVVKTQYSPITLTDNNTLNSIRLFDAIAADKENAMFSPVSLNMALGMIEAGAKGDTKTALDSYLQTENFADFAESYMKSVKEWNNRPSYSEEYKNVLEIANSFWMENGFPFNDDYKQLVSKKFDAEIKNVNFSDSEKTLNEINGWVNEKTHEMIPSILNDCRDMTAVLINAIYFESPWSDDWYINTENKESFTLTDGTSKEIPLMYNGGDSYFENGKATAFSCNYMNNLEFIGILPKETGEFTLESLDIPALLDSRTEKYDVSAVMPRLNFESYFSLKAALSAAGLENIFESGADFSGMSGNTLFVSEILQKTKIELDENGTRAAAVTANIMTGGGAAEVKQLKTVRLDRPFAFMIYDKHTDQILFIGKVTTIDG